MVQGGAGGRRNGTRGEWYKEGMEGEGEGVIQRERGGEREGKGRMRKRRGYRRETEK